MSKSIFFLLLHNAYLDGERKVKRHQLLYWENQSWNMDGKGANLSHRDSYGGVLG